MDCVSQALKQVGMAKGRWAEEMCAPSRVGGTARGRVSPSFPPLFSLDACDGEALDRKSLSISPWPAGGQPATSFSPYRRFNRAAIGELSTLPFQATETWRSICYCFLVCRANTESLHSLGKSCGSAVAFPFRATHGGDQEDVHHLQPNEGVWEEILVESLLYVPWNLGICRECLLEIILGQTTWG